MGNRHPTRILEVALGAGLLPCQNTHRFDVPRSGRASARLDEEHHIRQVNRRTFLGFSALATAGVVVDGWGAPVWAQDVRGLPLTKDVATTAGKIRGVVRFGVNQFWGVPYAASTEGANRFMPPVARAPWTGTRDCFAVGNRSPQDPDGPISEVFALDRQEPMGEDCLNLNVFTPALTGSRPVKMKSL